SERLAIAVERRGQHAAHFEGEAALDVLLPTGVVAPVEQVDGLVVEEHGGKETVACLHPDTHQVLWIDDGERVLHEIAGLVFGQKQRRPLGLADGGKLRQNRSCQQLQRRGPRGRTLQLEQQLEVTHLQLELFFRVEQLLVLLNQRQKEPAVVDRDRGLGAEGS